jgi:hypothetical protein
MWVRFPSVRVSRQPPSSSRRRRRCEPLLSSSRRREPLLSSPRCCPATHTRSTPTPTMASITHLSGGLGRHGRKRMPAASGAGPRVSRRGPRLGTRSGGPEGPGTPPIAPALHAPSTRFGRSPDTGSSLVL